MLPLMVERRRQDVPVAVERRKPGRPPLPKPDPPVHPRAVRLDRDVDDAVCRLSTRHGISVHALLKLAVRRFVSGISSRQTIPAAPERGHDRR